MALSGELKHSLPSLLSIAEEWDEAILLVCVYDYRSAILKFQQLIQSLTKLVNATKSQALSNAELPDRKLIPKLWFNVGAIYSSLGDSPLAIEAFKFSLEIDEDSAVTWFALGIEHYRAKEFKEAYVAFDRSKSVFEIHKNTRVRLETFEMMKKSPNDSPGSSKNIIRRKWNLRRSKAEANAQCAVEAMKNPNVGKEILEANLNTLPKNTMYGPNKVPVHNSEVEKKLAEAARLRTHLTKAIEAEQRTKSGIVRSMSEGAASRSKPLPKLPGDFKAALPSSFGNASDDDGDLNPSSVYTSLHTSAKLASPYDSHNTKKEIEGDSAGLPESSKRHTAPHELKVQIPRSSSRLAQETPRFKLSPSTASTSNAFVSPIFSTKANSLSNAAFTFTPPTQTYPAGPPTSIKTSFDLSPAKDVSTEEGSLIRPFRGPEPPHQNAFTKARIRAHPKPEGPGQWLWRPEMYPIGMRPLAYGELLFKFPENSDYEVFPDLPVHMAQPGEWVWEPDNSGQILPVTPDLPAQILKRGKWQPHNPSKAKGDLLFTLDLDSIEEENGKDDQADYISNPKSPHTTHGSPYMTQQSRVKQSSPHMRHGSPRTKHASPLRQVFPGDDHHPSQLELDSGLTPWKPQGTASDALSYISEEGPEMGQKPKSKSKSKLRQTGLFDGSWQNKLDQANLDRYSASINLHFDDSSEDNVGKRWQDQLIGDPPANLLGDNLPNNQSVGLGISENRTSLFENMMRDLSGSNGGRQVVEEAYTALTSGSTISPRTPRKKKGGSTKTFTPMTPRAEHQDSLLNLAPNIFEGPSAHEYRSSKSTKTVKTPKFSDIDYKHASFQPGFELKPTVFEGFKVYDATPKPSLEEKASSSPTDPSTPEKAATPKKATTPEKPTTPEKATTPEHATTPTKASPPPKGSSPKTPQKTSPLRMSFSPKKATTSPEKESALDSDSDAAAASGDTVRNARLSHRSRKESPPTRAGFRLENTPEKNFASKPLNQGYRARQGSDSE